MTASRFLADDAGFWAGAAVICPVLFLIVYSWRHRWWHDTYGRCLFALAAALAGARLSQALHMWGLDWPWLAWVSANAVGAGPVVFLVLTWKIMCPRLPWVRRRENFENGLDKILEEAGRDDEDRRC